SVARKMPAPSEEAALKCELSVDGPEQDFWSLCLKSHFIGTISLYPVQGATSYYLVDSITYATGNAHRFIDYRMPADQRDRIAVTHASVVRHIFGNPFRPYHVPVQWPLTLVQLADSLYQGQECRLPLSDAVEEAGHLELAEHFREEAWHPKGC